MLFARLYFTDFHFVHTEAFIVATVGVQLQLPLHLRDDQVKTENTTYRACNLPVLQYRIHSAIASTVKQYLTMTVWFFE